MVVAAGRSIREWRESNGVIEGCCCLSFFYTPIDKRSPSLTLLPRSFRLGMCLLNGFCPKPRACGGTGYSNAKVQISGLSPAILVRSWTAPKPLPCRTTPVASASSPRASRSRVPRLGRTNVGGMTRTETSCRRHALALMVRLPAGRLHMSYEAQVLCFLTGANSISTGEKLLTTLNPSRSDDDSLFDLLAFKVKPAFEQPCGSFSAWCKRCRTLI